MDGLKRRNQIKSTTFKKMTRRNRKGMRIGTGHTWHYKHQKTTDNGKKFTIYQIKKRNKKSPRGSGMPIGSKLHWKIKATETVRRLHNGKYLITMKGMKKQAGYTTKKHGRYKR